MILLALLEIGLRVTGIETTKPNPPRIYQESETENITYELKPNLDIRAFRSRVQTDGSGFRLPSPEPNKPLIAVLGDSITFGYGLENHETIPSQLQTYFPEYAVLNAGVPGYGIREEAAVMMNKIAQEPEVLVLIVHPNDIENVLTPQPILDEDGILRSADWTPEAEYCDPITRGLMSLIPKKCFLDQHSAIYRVIKKVVNARQGQRIVADRSQKERDTPSEEEFSPEQIERYRSELQRLIWHHEELPRLLVFYPEWKLHTETRATLAEMALNLGFAFLDLYEHVGNHPKSLSWDTVHPHPETAAEVAGLIAKELEKLLSQ